MNAQYTKSVVFTFALMLVAGSVSHFASANLPASLLAKVEADKKRLIEWAAHPDIVAAVKEANPKNGIPDMSNGKWDEVGDKEPVVAALLANKAGVLLRKWEAENKSFNKLVLRDVNSNAIAATIKPLIYKNSTRPVFINAMKGQAWTASEVKPDPTTQIKSVQASAPVLEGGKVIGVIHAGISVE